MSKTEFDTTLMEAEISSGIDVFIAKHAEKHGFTTDYSVQKKCGLNDNAVDSIRKKGGATLKTLFKLGVGVGYKPRIKNKDEFCNGFISVVIKVLKDFEVK